MYYGISIFGYLRNCHVATEQANKFLIGFFFEVQEFFESVNINGKVSVNIRYILKYAAMHDISDTHINLYRAV